MQIPRAGECGVGGPGSDAEHLRLTNGPPETSDGSDEDGAMASGSAQEQGGRDEFEAPATAMQHLDPAAGALATFNATCYFHVNMF